VAAERSVEDTNATVGEAIQKVKDVEEEYFIRWKGAVDIACLYLKI